MYLFSVCAAKHHSLLNILCFEEVFTVQLVKTGLDVMDINRVL